jgi:tetratricopeptide (TPR) repeat protein
VPSLAPLKSKDLDWVQQRLQRRQYTAGETILRRGVHGDFLEIVEAGQVDIIFQTPGGRNLTTTLHPGDHFSLPSESPSSAAVRAVTPATLWTLNQAEVAGLSRRLSSVSPSSTARLPGFRLLVDWLATPFNAVQQRPRLAKFSLAAVAILLIWAALTSPRGQTFLADLCYARGCRYLEQGQANAALQEFEAALKMNPVHAASYNALGLVYYQQGQLERALVAFEQASHVDPDSDVVQNNLGLVYNHRGETDKALQNLHRATDLSNNVPQVYVNLGNLYLAEDDWLNAGRAYREALRLNPKLSMTHHNLGVAYYRLRQLADARSEFDRALQLDPDLEAAYLGLGVVAFEQSQFRRAQTAFQRAVELDPQDAIAYFYLGLTHKGLDHQDQAIEAFERALGLTCDPVVREQAEWYLRELWGLP